jgi:formylglycine-generating enzyme required for sulfatase activity
MEVVTMSKSIIFLSIAAFAALIGGCIISRTPAACEVTLPLEQKKIFSVKVFPADATYAWTLDGSPLADDGNSYEFTPTGGEHTLTVKASHAFGTDTQTWHIVDPIEVLLNSMISIPSGTFMMGNANNSVEQPVHEVTLQGFEIGAYEVTQAQYESVIGYNPSHFQEVNGFLGTENNPVEQISWSEAREFCMKLSALTGRTFTLPSESQWEYACRAGSTGAWSFGDWEELLGLYAWYFPNSAKKTHPAGRKLPNAWGLYDMHGNVSEICLDSWHDSYAGAPADGSAWDPESGTEKVHRGGGWTGYASGCRSDSRSSSNLDYGDEIMGFRLAVSAQ